MAKTPTAPPPAAPAPVEPRIVEAVATAAGQTNRVGLKPGMMEKVMVEAAMAAQAEGITDPNVIRERKLAARAKLKEDIRLANEKLAAEEAAKREAEKVAAKQAAEAKG